MTHPPDANDHTGDLVKLHHCPTHGCFHLSVGKATVHLTPRELLLVGAAIERWWNEHPDEIDKLPLFNWFPQPERNAS